MALWLLDIIFWAFVVLWTLFHSLANNLAAKHNPHCHSTGIDLDDRLPFVPGFIVLYLSGYVLGTLAYLLTRSRQTSPRVMAGYALLAGVGGLFYILYPCRAERREGLAVTNLFTYLVSALQKTLKPYNTLPSMHVAFCLYSALIVMQFTHLGLGMLLIAWAALVALATLLAKQHTILDVAAGVALSLVAYWLVVLAVPPT